MLLFIFLENNPPTLDIEMGSNSRILVYQDIVNLIQVTGNDEDGDKIFYELFDNTSGTTINQNGTISYFPNLTNYFPLG